jgi:hypothetical protein
MLLRTELTNPALCAFAFGGVINEMAPTNNVSAKARGTNLFIKAPILFPKPTSLITLGSAKLGNYKE